MPWKVSAYFVIKRPLLAAPLFQFLWFLEESAVPSSSIFHIPSSSTAWLALYRREEGYQTVHCRSPKHKSLISWWQPPRPLSERERQNPPKKRFDHCMATRGEQHWGGGGMEVVQTLPALFTSARAGNKYHNISPSSSGLSPPASSHYWWCPDPPRYGPVALQKLTA